MNSSAQSEDLLVVEVRGRAWWPGTQEKPSTAAPVVVGGGRWKGRCSSSLSYSCLVGPCL